MSDAVNHPNHYHVHTGHETLDVIVAWGFVENYYVANCLKYLSRHRLKGKPLEDLKKCRFYLEQEIKRLENAKEDV